MADEDKAITTVQHTLTNYKSGIEPFAGRVNGQVRQGVEIFLQSVEDLFSSKGITDPVDQFREAKSHLNLSAGDLGENVRSFQFRDCRTWPDLKAFLRSLYGSGEEKDIVLGLRKVLKLHDRAGNSFGAQNAKINDHVFDFANNLSASVWSSSGGKSITIENLSRLLQLAVGLHSLPDALVNSFDETFTPQSTEKTVRDQINKHISKMPVMDNTILKGRSRGDGSTSSVCAVSKPQSSSSTNTNTSGNFSSFQSGPKPSSGSGLRKGLRCYNCDREGHAKMNCLVRYCGFHQSNTHNWKDCKALNRSFQPHNRSRSVDRRQKGPMNSWNKSANSRPSSPARPNFQKFQSKGGKG